MSKYTVCGYDLDILHSRMLPIVHTKVKNDDKRLLEEARQEELLFGPITD